VPYHLFWALANKIAAEEEVSRRKGHTTALGHTTPTPAPVIERTSTTSAAMVMPLALPTPCLPSPAEATVIETTTTNSVVSTPPASLTPSSPSPPLQESSPTAQRSTPRPNIEDERQLPPLHQTAPPISPDVCPPGHETTEFADLLDQPTSEQDLPSDLPPDAFNRFARPSSPAGAFVYAGSMPFIPPAIQYFQTVCAGQQWTDMVASFLRLEELPPPNGVCVDYISIYPND
jgi:hypothetical protein